MDKELENTILHYLRGFEAKLDAMIADLDEIGAIIGRIETTMAEMHQKVEGMDGQLTRIERRLDPSR